MSENNCLACGEDHSRRTCPTVEAEIAELRKGGWGFIPDEYRRHRLNGLKPERIDYDMCHVFR